MQKSLHLLIFLFLCGAVFCAGCTQSAPQETIAPVPGTATVIDSAQLGLTQSDVPQEFTREESRAKTPADVSNLAMELGWQDGYVVRFSSPADDEKGKTTIIQTIAIYPERTIADVITLAEQQDRSDRDLTYTDLPVQGLGDNARAFSGTAVADILVKPADASPVFSSMNTDEVQAVFKNNVAEIIFSKGKTFEVFRMTGPSPDTALLVNLAKKAYAKIP